MINIGLYYKVKDGHGAEFENYFTNVIALLKGADFGFCSGKLYKEVGDMGEYMLYTEWENNESFGRFMQSKEFSDTVEFGKTIIEGKPRHRIFKD